MPVIKSAKKKLKVDKKREFSNKKIEVLIDFVVKQAQKKPTSENIQKAFSAIDKGVKINVFHKNKGARIKSRLSKLMKRTSVATQNKSLGKMKPKSTKKVKK